MTLRLKENQLRFLNFLFEQSEKKERGVLAALRRGLNAPPGEDLNMVRYIARFIPDFERGTSKEKIYYLVAALFAYHQIAINDGNFGNHMQKTVSENNEEATERRFVILLNAHQDDLADYLRQAVSLLKSKEIGIHWQQLLNDLMYWDHPERFVQRNWANSFWGYFENNEKE